MTNLDEQELIHRAGHGSEEAFEQLVRAYEKPVYIYAFGCAGIGMSL